MTFSTPKISSKWWAKLGRLVCIGYAVMFFLFTQQAMNEKGNVGMRKSDAHDVTVFTVEVSRLIAHGKQQQAKELLDKFNKEYLVLSGHPEAKTFLEGLT
jgi:hypothetical protein